MNGLTIQQFLCFDAVITEGGFQAAADKLGRSHPSVFTAIKNLEAQLGVALFDREGYRVTLTEAGRVLLCIAASFFAALLLVAWTAVPADDAAVEPAFTSASAGR